jgi:hypothetical protein
MNTELLKAKMADFFNTVSTEYLLEKYQKMGYTFEDTCIKWGGVESYQSLTIKSLTPVKMGWIDKNILRKKQIVQKKLTSEFPGSFFLANLVI